MAIEPWCDAKHYDHVNRQGIPYASSTYCTCSKTPGHTDTHKCWGCGREWPDVLVIDEVKTT